MSKLLSPSVYRHHVARVELVQTHISYVFLTGDHVCKVKKPVDMGSLDYSTLEKRRFYCQEEGCEIEIDGDRCGFRSTHP